MLLEHEGLNATLRTVFTVYAAFWISVLVILFIATGVLLKQAERLSKKQHGGSDHSQAPHH